MMMMMMTTAFCNENKFVEWLGTGEEAVEAEEKKGIGEWLDRWNE